MPIPILGTTLPPPPPPGRDLGSYAFQFERAGRSPMVLNESTGIVVQIGAQGLDGPTFDIAEWTPAGWDGALPNQVTSEPREVFLPLLMQSGDLMSLRALKHSLMSYLNPRLGPVTLRVTTPDSESRLIDGIYRAGMDGAMDADTWWVARQKVGVIIRCSAQPFWRSDTDWSVTWKQASSPAALLPILPLAPEDSNALNATNSVMIDGDLPTQPIWYVTGPLTSVQINDVGAGVGLTLAPSGGIAGGATWVIDTRRGRQAVYAPNGTRQRAALNAGAVMFPMQPGISSIQTVVVGASSGAQVYGTAPVLWLAA